MELQPRTAVVIAQRAQPPSLDRLGPLEPRFGNSVQAITTQRRASTTKPLAAGSRDTTRWRIPWTFDHSRQRSAANAPS
jgi:hypothetical protein